MRYMTGLAGVRLHGNGLDVVQFPNVDADHAVLIRGNMNARPPRYGATTAFSLKRIFATGRENRAKEMPRASRRRSRIRAARR